ncbi:MerR family transcriptional regulator [Nocardioides KLBMP 9356]|uniref:MerR family transcriptional regulator n=1 Tax=Nocardioides potassii TaxID=2911371 RepID=A0ABS9HD02_9ACTN|nr:DICT sensory domain-containing protein [Nocardioides potassii]MCF6378181.1 MerR family transcriptional regulator [Nocardioides potassii]
MTSGSAARFGIGVLAERTGLTPEVVRAWERRFGLEIGVRTSAGHRRYTDDDVSLVREILDGRDRGLTLAVAIKAATDRARGADRASVHATLADEHPELRRMRLDHRTLVALSTAMEDELMARGEPTVVWGGFQDGQAFDRSRGRWEELARTSTWCVVLADFTGWPHDEEAPEGAGRAGRPVLVDLPPDSPMLREWCVVALAPGFAVLLSAWEVPSSSGPRTYETFLSTRRSVVVSAARALTAITSRAGVAAPPEVDRVLVDAGEVETSVRDSDRLWARAIEALAGQAGRQR